MRVDPAAPAHPALRLYGGKWRLAPWIISHFPQHTCYVEPFCGAASVLLRKPPSEIEVINDLDGEIVNFFEVLRSIPESLIKAIELTPYSRAEYNAAWKQTECGPLERARRLYICCWQGWHGSKGSRPSGWRFQSTKARGTLVTDDWSRVDHLYDIARRLKQIFIENDGALEVIERYDTPETLFYVDPPYLSNTRSERWKKSAYACEIDTEYHEHLLDLLQNIQGMAVVSSYPSPLYESGLTHWEQAHTKAQTSNPTKSATEILWLSPRCIEALPQQLTLPLDTEAEPW